MAGHSKFKNTMHRKGAQDAKKSKLFGKIGREITVATKAGGGDPNMNPRLRLAMATARVNSMPRDRIEKAVQNGLGLGDTSTYEEIRYEGYGPGGVAVIVEALTDSRNRTAGDVRSTFSKYGGNLGETNSVSFMFDHKGEVIFPLSKGSAEAMFEAALEAGADNVETDDESHRITCAPADFAAVREALLAKFGEPEKSGFVWIPNVQTTLDHEQAIAMMKLIDVLEDNDDVQHVTTNFEVSDEVMSKLVAAG